MTGSFTNLKNSSQVKKFVVGLILFLITLFGFALRLQVILKDYSFVFDESWDFIQANSFKVGDFLSGKYWDVSLHPFLHYLFLHFWSKIRIDEFFLRLPFVIAGSLSILLFYLISKEIFESCAWGLLAAFLYACLGFSIYYSIHIRIVQFLLMFELAAFYFFLKAYKKNQAKDWLLFTFFLALAFYEDYSAIWFWLIANFFFVFQEFFSRPIDTKKIKNWLWGNLGLFLLYLPWLPVFFNHLQGSSEFLSYLGRPNFKTLLNFLISQMFGFEWAFFRALEEYQTPQRYLEFAVLLPFLISTGYLLCRLVFRPAGEWPGKMGFLLFCFFTPLMVSFWVSQFFPIFQDRNLAIFSFYPILVLVMSLKVSPNRLAKLLFIFMVTWFLSYNLYTLNYLSNNSIGVSWRNAALYLKENLNKGDVLVAAEGGFEKPLEYYLIYRLGYNFEERGVKMTTFLDKEKFFSEPQKGHYWLLIDSWWEKNVVGNYWERFLKEAEQWGIPESHFSLAGKHQVEGIVMYEVSYQKEN